MDTQIVVLDTSAFTNPDSARYLGINGHLALRNFLSLVADRHPLDTLVYTTPSVWAELQRFPQMNVDKIPKSLLGQLHLKSPNRQALQLSGQLLWELVGTWRLRSDAALKYACDVVKDIYATPKTRKQNSPAPKRTKSNEKRSSSGRNGGPPVIGQVVDALPIVRSVSPPIKIDKRKRKRDFAPYNGDLQKRVQQMRGGVRKHLREGIVDSQVDLGVLLLAKELGAKVLSSDKGLLEWAGKMGLAVLPADMAKAWLTRR